MSKISSNVRGISFLVLAMFIISLQNIAIKWIGGDYPVLEIVIFRSLVALPFTMRASGDGRPRNGTGSNIHEASFFFSLTPPT
jgi:drug/metabolite transporter (DMT)-like permease